VTRAALHKGSCGSSPEIDGSHFWNRVWNWTRKVIPSQRQILQATKFTDSSLFGQGKEIVGINTIKRFLYSDW